MSFSSEWHQARGRKAAAEALGNFGPAAAESPRAVPRLLRLVKQAAGFYA